MIKFTSGNLLDADVDALVNTVNTVGVMGKGIALMFKERFPENFKRYAGACKREEIQIGRMFVTDTGELNRPRWIINFPTKQHWRSKTRLQWIEEGLEDLRRVIRERDISSIAIPPLGCGNGGLEWAVVRPAIEGALVPVDGLRVLVFEPTRKYQNVAKKRGVEKLTPARALVAEMVRRYSVLGLECSILEIQKLAWFLERVLTQESNDNSLDLQFEADVYGPFAYRLTHLLNSLDGSYLHCHKRLADASPTDTIRFNESKRETITAFIDSPEGRSLAKTIEVTDRLIDGFQSPLGLEALATVDWLLHRQGVEPDLPAIRAAIDQWPAGPMAARRKQQVFSDKLLHSAIERLQAMLNAG